MPRKNSEKYQYYDRIKQYFTLNFIFANCSELGIALSDDWEQWKNDYTDALANEVHLDSKILDFSQTDNYFPRDRSDLLDRGKKIAADIALKMKEYRGPLKEIMESVYYVVNPNNGDQLDLYVDQPDLKRIMDGPIAGAPNFTRKQKGKGVKEYILDAPLNKERTAIYGEFFKLLQDFYKGTKGFVEVLYERQKAEKKKETGLDPVYAAKYAAAIDRMVDAFDSLKSAAKERYKRTDLSDVEKDLTSYKDPVTKEEITLLNNSLWENTSANPNKISRNGVAIAMENFRAQSKAIKAGWPLNEARIMGILAEAAAEAENSIKACRLDIKEDERHIRENEAAIKAASAENKDAKQEEAKLKRNQQDLEDHKKKLQNAEQAMTLSKKLYEKYEKIKNPDFYQRQEALKDLQDLLAMYPEDDKSKKVISIAHMSYKAAEEKLTDPYDFKEKTRREQAEAMLKTLKDVNSWGRSSDNFEALVQSVEKLVELSRKYPDDMSQEQFQAYERQNADVIKKINRYRKGKEKQQADYKTAHNGREKTISEYTAKRINAVNKLYLMEYTHLRMNSEGYTKEYTGTPHERAMATYERRIREEARRRKNVLGRGYKGKFEGGESYNLDHEVNSFCRSLYIEKMKERYQYDPDFTARDFSESLKVTRIKEGSREEYEEIKAHPKFKKHIMDAIVDRIQMEDEGDLETYDHTEYKISGDVPNGVGHDWVKFELKNYRALYGISDPSEGDYSSELDDDSHEDSYEDDAELNIIDTGSKDTKKKDKMIDDFEIEDFGIREDRRKENRDREGIETDILVPQDNLAGKIFAMMEKDPPRKSEDPKYISIAKEIAEHAAGEKDGTNTKLSDETLMKMAKYIDSQYDLGKMTAAETKRWNIVNSAFRQYTQNDENFEKSAGEFKYTEMLGKKGEQYKHGHGCYKNLFYGSLEKSAVETGKEYQKKNGDTKCAEAVKAKAYQVVMTDVVEGTFAHAKNVSYTKINNAYDSTADKKQRGDFIKGLPASFKTHFEKLILDGAGKGTFNSKYASDSCDKALAMSMDEAKKGKDVAAEKKLKDLMNTLKRDPRRVDKYREKVPAPKKSI